MKTCWKVRVLHLPLEQTHRGDRRFSWTWFSSTFLEVDAGEVSDEQLRRSSGSQASFSLSSKEAQSRETFTLEALEEPAETLWTFLFWLKSLKLNLNEGWSDFLLQVNADRWTRLAELSAYFSWKHELITGKSFYFLLKSKETRKGRKLPEEKFRSDVLFFFMISEEKQGSYFKIFLRWSVGQFRTITGNRTKWSVNCWVQEQKALNAAQNPSGELDSCRNNEIWDLTWTHLLWDLVTHQYLKTVWMEPKCEEQQGCTQEGD